MSEQESAKISEESKPEEVQHQVDVEALVQRIEQLESTNRRILDESKQYKDRFRSLKSEVESKEKAELEESENWKELLDMEKNKSHELNSKLQDFKRKSLQKEMMLQVAKRVPDAYDVDDIIKTLPRDVLSIDEESLEIKGVDEAVTFIREKKPWMFKQEKSTGQIAGRPSSDKGVGEPSPEDEKRAFEDALKEMLG